MSYISCNGSRVYTAPRKLRVNDVICVTLDLGCGSVRIAVSGEGGDFEYTIDSGGDLPQGSPADFWFGATFGKI